MKIQSLLVTVFLASAASAQLLRSNSLDPQLVRRLNRNTDLINRVIELLLVPANEALSAAIPDPVNIPLDQSIMAGMTQAAGMCTGEETVSVAINLGDLAGQSTTEIQSLEVREGSEDVSCGCPCPVTFSGLFDIVLSADNYTVDGTVSITTTPDCGSVESNVTIFVVNPTFNGVVELAGEIRGDDATITNINVTSLTASCDSVNTTYAPELPAYLEDAQTTVNEFISENVKSFLSETLVDLLTLAIDAALMAARQSWSFLTGVGWALSFAQANAVTNAGNFLKYGLGIGN